MKSAVKHQKPPLFHLPSSPLANRSSPKNTPSPSSSRTYSSPSLLSLAGNNDTKTVIDGTIRYIKSSRGLEIQRYSSQNWLCTDILSKDACQTQEKTFREIVEKQEQNELLSRSIYTSEYYRVRRDALLQSFEQKALTHIQWAEQSYQTNCLKTLHTQAHQREQSQLDLIAQRQRQRRAENAFNKWKESKSVGNPELYRKYSNTINGQHSKGVTSVLSHPSSAHPKNTTKYFSVTSMTHPEPKELPSDQPNNSLKTIPNSTNASLLLDEQRWSLKAMVKRIVGLAEPVPSTPKNAVCRGSSLMNLRNDDDFKSISSKNFK